MQEVIIFHGTECKPTDFWYPWLKNELEKNNKQVQTPYFPTMNLEPIESFLPKVLESIKIEENTVLIGHSAGATLILSILENLEFKVLKAILVAGFSETHPDAKQMKILQKKYNWNKIKQNVNDIIFINSVNDPWGCNDEQGRYLFENLGGTLIIKKDGHFGSNAKNQPYKEFKLLYKLCGD